MFRKLFSWGWSPFLITVLAVVGAAFEWPVVVMAPVLVIILAIGLLRQVRDASREGEELPHGPLVHDPGDP